MSGQEKTEARFSTGPRNTKGATLSARALASTLGLALPLAVACATTTEGTPSMNNSDAASGSSQDAQGGGHADTGGGSGSSSGGGSGSSGGGSSSGSGSSSGGGSGSSSGAVDSSVPVTHPCTTNATLPYPVDGNGTGGSQAAFIASGYEGDYCAIIQNGTSGACPGHTITGALGKCWSATVFRPPAPCGPNPFVNGWAGVVWQYPMNNWTDPSTMGGLNLCGATKVSFWAAGATGTETVSFQAGNMGYSASLSNQSLSTTWTQYTMTLSGMPDSNASVGFAWSTTEPVAGDGGAGAADGGGAADAGVAADAGTTDAGVGPTVKFMIDDIQWQ